MVDDGSADETGARAAAAGARVIRHPYNSEWRAVKTGVRQATGEHPDPGRGRSAPRRGCAERDPEPRRARSRRRRARSFEPRDGRPADRQCRAELDRNALTGRDIPDLTSGLRGARREHLREFLHLLPNGFSTPTTTTLAFLKAGYNVTFVPATAAARVGSSNIRTSRDGLKFFLILVRVITIFSPMRIFLPIALYHSPLGLVMPSGRS